MNPNFRTIDIGTRRRSTETPGRVLATRARRLVVWALLAAAVALIAVVAGADEVGRASGLALAMTWTGRHSAPKRHTSHEEDR